MFSTSITIGDFVTFFISPKNSELKKKNANNNYKNLLTIILLKEKFIQGIGGGS